MNTITVQSILSFGPNYFVAVRNPRFANAEHTLIACEVNFKHVDFEEWTPFTADPGDYMPYSQTIFDECLAEKWGTVAEYVPPPPPEEYVPIEAAPDQPVTTGTQTL